jgi:hypothetical protein
MSTEGDVVLIYVEDKPLSFARIEQIEPDHKPDWYHVRFLLLQVPLQEVTWILRDIYINGEQFTMGGKPMRIEKVEAPPKPATSEAQTDETSKSDRRKSGKVISLKDMKK